MRRGRTLQDIKGERFGRLTAVYRDIIKVSRITCLCDCGTTHDATISNLRKGAVRSCGCLKKERAHNLLGLRFGKVVVTHREANSKAANPRWGFRCDCGGTGVTLTQSLKSGHTTSCGCVRIAATKAALTKHGCADGTPEYRCWKHIHWRTSNRECPQYKNYGGRGIKVCKRWRSFENFLEDMGERPSPKHSIDRINNELGYRPDNCRWATHGEQAVNKRNNRFVTYQGETLTISQWAKLKNIRYLTLYYRLVKTDMPLELAMETPAGGFKK